MLLHSESRLVPRWEWYLKIRRMPQPAQGRWTRNGASAAVPSARTRGKSPGAAGRPQVGQQQIGNEDHRYDLETDSQAQKEITGGRPQVGRRPRFQRSQPAGNLQQKEHQQRNVEAVVDQVRLRNRDQDVARRQRPPSRRRESPSDEKSQNQAGDVGQQQFAVKPRGVRAVECGKRFQRRRPIQILLGIDQPWRRNEPPGDRRVFHFKIAVRNFP